MPTLFLTFSSFHASLTPGTLYAPIYLRLQDQYPITYFQIETTAVPSASGL